MTPSSAHAVPTAGTPADGPGAAAGPLKAPFPYFGGKAKVAADVWDRLGNPHTYLEPFAGSLAVLLARPVSHQWWSRRETVGDFSGHVVNFYRAVAADPQTVADHANWPVTEADLTARHLWLVRYQDDLADLLAADPDYYDAKAAGWWAWGISAWVGGEWCSGLGAWHPGTEDGPGVYRKLPMIAGNHSGKGVHRPLPGPIADTPERLDVTGAYRAHLLAQFTAISDRLRRVRIACGDWTRLTRSAAEPTKGEVTGVFLDPPYDLSLRRGDLYGPADRSAARARSSAPTLDLELDDSDADVSSDQVHQKAREWALSIGDDPRYRVAYCSYSTPEEDALFTAAGWTPMRWTAAGGYGLQADNTAKTNRDLEVIWFSPHCLNPDGEHLFSFNTGTEDRP